jgi:hypothetical protein
MERANVEASERVNVWARVRWGQGVHEARRNPKARDPIYALSMKDFMSP